jgi:hypothetical protein
MNPIPIKLEVSSPKSPRAHGSTSSSFPSSKLLRCFHAHHHSFLAVVTSHIPPTQRALLPRQGVLSRCVCFLLISLLDFLKIKEVEHECSEASVPTHRALPPDKPMLPSSACLAVTGALLGCWWNQSYFDASAYYLSNSAVS